MTRKTLLLEHSDISDQAITFKLSHSKEIQSIRNLLLNVIFHM